MNRISVFITIIGLSVISCSGPAREPDYSEEMQVDFSKIETTRLSKRLIADLVECSGTIDVPPNQRAAMYAPIGGNIFDIKVIPGDVVKKGQLLYRLRHQDIIKIQENYLVAYNEERLQSTNLKRKQELFDANNVSERELREVTRDYEIAKANKQSLAEQLKVIGLSASQLIKNGIQSTISVKSPISGYVSSVDAISGSYINMNNRIMTLLNLDHYHVELDVYADKISDVKEGQLVEFVMAGHEEIHMAEVYLIGKEVDEETRTIAIHAHMLIEEPFVVGSKLYASILVSSDSLWAVPEASVVNAENKNFVLIVKGDTLRPVKVEVGKSYMNYVAIKNYADLLDEVIIAEDAYYYF